MSKRSHISAIFDNAFQSRAGSPGAGCIKLLITFLITVL